FQAQVRNQVLAPHPAQSVLEFHELNEYVVLRVNFRRVHGGLEIKGQPLLDAAHTGALSKVHEQNDVQHQRRGQNRIPAQEIDLDLHGVAEPPEDVDVVPTLFGVAARRIVLDPHLV